jgi:bacterioferritin-associated ferredoxin
MCRVVTRKVIESVIEGGAQTVEEVGNRSGAGTDCGKCRRMITRLLEVEAQARQVNPASSNRIST